MNPKICPVCSGSGSVPEDLYRSHFPAGWEPGDMPPIREDCPETECRTCEGLGVVWPPKGSEDTTFGEFDSEGTFTYVDESSRVFVTSAGVSYTNLYDWEEVTAPERPVSLTLIAGDSEDD
jgi:hypothetical protein